MWLSMSAQRLNLPGLEISRMKMTVFQLRDEIELSPIVQRCICYSGALKCSHNQGTGSDSEISSTENTNRGGGFGGAGGNLQHRYTEYTEAKGIAALNKHLFIGLSTVDTRQATLPAQPAPGTSWLLKHVGLTRQRWRNKIQPADETKGKERGRITQRETSVTKQATP